MKRVIHGIFYLKNGTHIEEICSFNEDEENKAAEVVSNITDIIEAASNITDIIEVFKKAKENNLVGTIQFNYTIADIREIVAFKFYDEVVDE